MTIDSFVTIGLAVVAWAISGVVTVTWMKAQHAVQMQYMEQKIEQINAHLIASDDRHEQLARDFNDHRVKVAQDLALHTNQCSAYRPRGGGQ